MSEKPIAGVVAAGAVASLVALCCLGPTVLGSVIGGIVGWLSGLGPGAAAGAGIATGLAAYGLFRWRRARGHRMGTS